MMGIGVLELLIVLGLLGAMVTGVVLMVVFFVRRPGSSQAGNLNLQPCPDCGAAISIRASVCPRCGGPLGGGPIDKSVV